MPLNEHYIQNQIRLFLGEHNILCFRVNVGTVKTDDGFYFHTGLPPGFPDLIAFGKNGDFYMIECKTKTGRLREDQKKFRDVMESRGFKYIVARSVEDIRFIVDL